MGKKKTPEPAEEKQEETIEETTSEKEVHEPKPKLKTSAEAMVEHLRSNPFK